MAEGRFATAINCIDGRVQLPVISHITSRYGADFVNMVTRPGVCGILASGNEADIAGIRDNVAMSVSARRAGLVAVCGHHDCAGNPADEAVQRSQVRMGVERVRGWGLPVKVIGLWIGAKWVAEEVE